MIHESIVPIASVSVTGTPPSFRSQPNFVPLKYGSSTKPVRSRTIGRWPASARSRHRSAVRRSCHTIARPWGLPVERSHATTVSRWFVIPMAATFDGSTRSRTSMSVPRTASQISAASCSTQPGCGKCCVNSRYAATVAGPLDPSIGTARDRTPVVPASMATIHVGRSSQRRFLSGGRWPGRFELPAVRRVGAGRCRSGAAEATPEVSLVAALGVRSSASVLRW